jgi:DNA-binding PucR family transcriptional regulator
LSPLVRWITALTRESADGFFNVSALQLNESGWPKGVWVYRMERWMLKGLRLQEQLAYAAQQVGASHPLNPSQAEQFLQTALREGRDWSYPVYSDSDVSAVHQQLEEHLSSRFDDTIARFRAENVNSFQIRIERARNLFDRRIEQDRQRIVSLRQNQRSDQAVRLAEARLRKAEENRQRKIDELTAKSQVDVDKSEIAAGIINTL